MLRFSCRILTATLLLYAQHAESAKHVELQANEEAQTFYVQISVAGLASDGYLVDTGAGYMTITEESARVLKASGEAEYVGELEGIMADGRVTRVPVYRLSRINIGGNCVLTNVEAAVIPGVDRGLFGLSALRRMAPFVFSTNPPTLQLNNCGQTASAP